MKSAKSSCFLPLSFVSLWGGVWLSSECHHQLFPRNVAVGGFDSQWVNLSLPVFKRTDLCSSVSIHMEKHLLFFCQWAHCIAGLSLLWLRWPGSNSLSFQSSQAASSPPRRWAVWLALWGQQLQEEEEMKTLLAVIRSHSLPKNNWALTSLAEGWGFPRTAEEVD